MYACDEVQAVQQLYSDLLTAQSHKIPIRQFLEQMARRIVVAHESGDTTVTTQIKCWHPSLVSCSVVQIMAHEFTLDDAQQTVAREFGFADWADVEERGAVFINPQFEAAVDALLSGNADELRLLLQRTPSLVRERSKFGHHSTLLHYVGSNGVETHRQVVPKNLADVTQILLGAGADVNATADMYGGGSTTLHLLTTSCHPIEAGVVQEVVAVLKNAGATA